MDERAFVEVRFPEKFQHSVGSKENTSLDALKWVRTVLLYLCHPSPKVVWLKAKKDLLQPVIYLAREMESV